jgi:hypothetical protein
MIGITSSVKLTGAAASYVVGGTYDWHPVDASGDAVGGASVLLQPTLASTARGMATPSGAKKRMPHPLPANRAYHHIKK